MASKTLKHPSVIEEDGVERERRKRHEGIWRRWRADNIDVEQLALMKHIWRRGNEYVILKA